MLRSEAFLITRQAGLKSHASFMIGNIGETEETVDKKHRFESHQWVDVVCPLLEPLNDRAFLNVELSVDKTWCPDAFLADGDTRELGLAVEEVRLV